MYIDLRFRLDGWADETIRELEKFAGDHRNDLRRCEMAGEFPGEIYKEMGRRGWLGSISPPEYGGLGGGPGEYCLIAEEVGRLRLVSPQVSVQGQRWLIEWGTDEQKQRYLRPMASGEVIFCECISEPTMGSSFKNMEATAVRDGSDWILNGEKTHVNLGANADVGVFYANSEEGLSSFFVDMREPGIRRRGTDPIGLRLIPTADVVFEDVRVPGGVLLGRPGEGMATFLSTFNLSRLGNASELIGMARAALGQAINYASSRKVGDSVVTDFQGMQWGIADAYASLFAASLVRDRASNLAEEGTEHSTETTLAKKLAIDASEQALEKAFALVGSYGLYHRTDFSAILQDVKVLRTAGGSLEVLRNYISRQVLRSDTKGGLA